MSVWVMPSVDVYENFLKRSQAVAGGRRRWAPPMQKCPSWEFFILSRYISGIFSENVLAVGFFFPASTCPL